MKKKQISAVAKAVAWILISVSALLFLMGAAATVIMIGEGIYVNTPEDTREKSFEEINRRYSLLALKNMNSGTNQEFFADKKFRYGIIEAKSLDGLNLNDDKTYVERNFTEKVNPKDLFTYSLSMSEKGQTEIEYRDGYLRGYAYAMQENSDVWDSIYADHICYDITGGIFYYSGGGKYYPVQSVSISERNASFRYDFNKKMYQNYWLLEEEKTVDSGADEAESIEEKAGENTSEEVLSQEYITFNMFDGTDMPASQFGTLILDGVRPIETADITLIDSSTIDPALFSDATDYYLDENYTLQVNTGQDTDSKLYWVVSITPEQIETQWNSPDMYVQATTMIHFAYQNRYVVWILLALCLAVGVGSFAFLMCAAGTRKGVDEIVPTLIDRIPLDILTILVAVVEGCLFFGSLGVAQVINNENVSTEVYIVLFTFAALCMGWLLLVYLLSLSVRVKLGKWWRNSVVYHVCKLLSSFFQMIWKDIDLLWKVILVLGVLSFLEFIGLVIFIGNIEPLVLWFLEKLILCPVILWAFVQMRRLKAGAKRIAEGDTEYKIDLSNMFMDFREHGENLNNISAGMNRAIGERMKSEHFKTELITNVSHDIKTPLTSIINYVDLLQKENLQNEMANEYLEVLSRQSDRLKRLIEDLIEASKASTGNLAVNLERLEAGIFMTQTVGEFEEKTNAAGLNLIIDKPDKPIYIMADSRHLWRVIDNLMNNICKYAQPQTRVYINLERKEGKAVIAFRNTSKYPLNISSEELMERFVRGDSSRNTEGSGLGLSIAKSLMDLMSGEFRLYVDGDLFKVMLEFSEVEP